MSKFFKFISCALFFVTLSAQLTKAAAIITVDQSGAINGVGMDGAAGIELILKYDTSLLSSPTVTKGGLIAKGMLAANTSSPGLIKVAIISTSPFTGNGQIASISFASNPGKGGIQSVSATMIDGKGQKLPVQALIAAVLSPSDAPVSTDSTDSTTPATSTTAGSSDSGVRTSTGSTDTNFLQTEKQGVTSSATGYTSGSVTFQTETTPTKTEQQIDTDLDTEYVEPKPPLPVEPIVVESTPEPAVSKTSDKKEISGTVQQTAFKSILDRFKTYQGDKSLPIMTALFSKDISNYIHQEPTVALSDGKTRIKIIVDIPISSATSPNFALDSGTILSVKKEGDKSRRWIIEALPDANVWKASLSILAGTEIVEYPLTVVPAIGDSLKADQSGWNVFMKDVGTPQKPRYDFNNDGVRDYIDQFIFVANHLTRK